jgi:hypothetical protein
MSDALVVDRSSGSILRVNGATLAVSEPVQPLGAGATGISVFVGGGAAYAIDRQRGSAVAFDPITLENLAGATSLASKVSENGSMVDRNGRLWILDETTGDLVSVAGATRTDSVRVGVPGKTLLVDVAGFPAVVDLAGRTASLVSPESGRPVTTRALDLRGDDVLSAATASATGRVILVASNRGVLMVTDLTGGRDQFVRLPESLGRVAQPVEVQNRVFVADVERGIVHVVDLAQARVIASVSLPGGPATTLELFAGGIESFIPTRPVSGPA